MRKFAGVLLAAAACGSSSSTVEVPSTEVTLEEPLAPSALVAMGIREKVAGSYDGGERATRSVTALVGACVRPMLEREPWLVGSLTYRWDVTRPEAISKGGDLAAFPASGCVEAALGKAIVQDGAKGSVEYTLEFAGTYEPAPFTEERFLVTKVNGLDWSNVMATPPEATEELAGTEEKLRRCAFGAAPALEDSLWLVMGVAADGTVTLGPNEAESEASTCMRRVLHAAKFPTEGRPYGLSVEFYPTDPTVEPAEPTGGAEFGIIGLLNSGAGGDPDAPTAPWSRDDSDPQAARGNMWGDAVGDSFGAGGLGLVGIGEGGGGRGEGIGLGTIGVIGKGSGTGQTTGFGSGRLGGSRTKPPSVRMGAASVSGRLPPEVIKRIVRQNFGRFRLCYENGLRNDPKLAGRVTVTFEITRAGDVAKVTQTNDLKDKGVGGCVAKAFMGLSFPQPEGGVVKVTYPINFSPGDTPAEPEPPPPPKTLAGKTMSALTMADVEGRLKERGLEFVRVPGATGGVFVREFGEVLSVFVADNDAALAGFGTCLTGDGTRALYVRGSGCPTLMSRLLD